MAGGSTRAVYAAIAGNSLVMVAKFGAFALTGSGAMLSEGIHSFADVGNQCLLAVGISRSQKIADEDHPYGYAREQFIWALISAVGIFFLGCGVTVYHGIHTLLHPEPLQAMSTALWVLLFAFVVEGWTFMVAWRAVSAAAKESGMSMRQYTFKGPDPMGVAVLLEDGAAVFGVSIAAAAIGMIQVTGDPRWDGYASIAIGVLLGAIAVFLIFKNREALIGQSIDASKRDRVLELLESDPVVETVRDIKATVIGPDKLRFKAEIEFDGKAVARRHLDEVALDALFASLSSREDLERVLVDYGDFVVDWLGDEIDRIEGSIRQAVPEVQHVDLEAD